MLTVAQLAESLGLEYRGDGEAGLTRVASLESAGPGALGFYTDRRQHRHLASTRATAVLLAAENLDDCPSSVLITDTPYLAFIRAAELLHPRQASPGGIHPRACVDPTAEVHADAWIGANTVVEAGATIAARVRIGPGCLIGAQAVVGEDTELVASVTLLHNVILGKRVRVHPGVVIGADGFGLINDGRQWWKVPQLGSVRIGDDVEIGANTTIDRGTLDDTVIGRGVKIDNQVQIAHNVTIGEHTAIAACVGISGSARIGAWCTLAGGVGVVGHLELADHVQVTGMSMVTHSLRRAGVYSAGTPLMSNGDWRRNVVRIKQLDALVRQVRQLKSDK